MKAKFNEKWMQQQEMTATAANGSDKHRMNMLYMACWEKLHTKQTI